MVKSLGSVTSFRAKKDRTTQHTNQQKNKTPKTLGFQGYIAERQGFEPWQRLHVDRLAICSITTLAPLQKENSKVIVPHKVNNLFFDIIQDTQSVVGIR